MRCICTVALFLCLLSVEVRPAADKEDKTVNGTPREDESEGLIYWCYVNFKEIYSESVSDPTVECIFNRSRDAKEDTIFKQCNFSNLTEYMVDGIVHVQQMVSTEMNEQVEVINDYYYTCCANITECEWDDFLEYKHHRKIIANAMRYAFPFEVDRTTFKGEDYESWKQQETCPGPSSRDIVKSKLDKCVIHVDTFSDVRLYIGPEKHSGLPSPLIYSEPEYTHVENSCWYSLSGNMSELNCNCESNREDCAVLKEADDIICVEKQTDLLNVVVFGSQALVETKAAKGCIAKYILSVSYRKNVYFTHSFKVTFGADRSNVCHSKHEDSSCVLQNEPLCPFGASPSSSVVRAEVLCCCGPKHGANRTFYHLCNLKQVDLMKVDARLQKTLRCGIFPHLYQHFFLNNIYKGQCIVHHDFEIDSSLKLIHGLNMKFLNNVSPSTIYSNENEVQVVDVLIDRSATKCLGRHREREIMAASKRKAWTIVIFKCKPKAGSTPCDTAMMGALNRTKLSDEYGTFCYVGKSTSYFMKSSSLFTKWCLERVTGIGKGMVIERGFLTVGSFATMKDLPEDFQCIKANNDSYRITFGKGKDHYKCYRRFGVPETTCCCKNADRTIPCNDAATSAHIDWNAVQYTSAIRKRSSSCRRRFLSKYENDEICNESLLDHSTVCFYVANLRSQTTDGGCVFPAKPKTRHRLASVCKTEHSQDILKSNKTVAVFSEEQYTRVFCCYSRYNCRNVMRQMQTYEKHFMNSAKRNQTVMEAADQESHDFELGRIAEGDTANTSHPSKLSATVTDMSYSSESTTTAAEI